jgi:hypothetical protein
VIHVPQRFKITPYIVASQTLFAKQPTKFIFSNIVHTIPKSKGSSDLRAAKMLISSVKKGYPILIFPEGDTTFNGETNYIEESTYKLIKKLNVDLITCKVSGGYLSKPRWATHKRKNRRIFLDYSIAIPKEELQDLSVEEIALRVKNKLYNNDYEYQRTHMIKHPGKNLAEGFDNVVYICPECEGVNTIVSSKNVIECSNCNTKGKMNEYGFIEGFKFDNIIDWDRFQKPLSHKLLDQEFSSDAKLYYGDYETDLRTLVGQVDVKYKNKNLIFSGAHNEIIPINQIKNPHMTLRRMFNFNYENKNYIVKLEKNVAAFLRVIQSKY